MPSFEFGPESALPEEGTAPMRAGRRDILIVQTPEGLFACEAMCTHEAASLCDGALLGDTIECPLHGAVFNLRTGSVEFGPAEQPLAVYPVRVEDGRVWVELDEVAA